MIKQLQAIFPSLILNPTKKEDTEYQWFITLDKDIIGIKKSELTQQTSSLLTTFLTPYNVKLPDLTLKEQQWTDLIKTEENTAQEAAVPFRFVCFSFPKNKLDPFAFKEVITEIFAAQIPILWENEHTGIIVEEQHNPHDEKISYEQIIDVLISDLYVKINFLVGPYLYHVKDAKHSYHVLLKGAKTAFLQSEKSVLSYAEAIPYVFADLAGANLSASITDMVLNGVEGDRELLHTIETFIECNLNISVTAKELFMHRNSLQYRIDKFNEKTGLDIRNFHHAMAVHLALLAKNIRNK